MDDTLKIVSLNACGIRDGTKWRAIFKFVKTHNPDIVLLQEIYSQCKDNFIWANQWGNKVIFSNG